MMPEINGIIAAQDKRGRWITHNDRYKKRIPGRLWDGEYEVRDRLSSAVFIGNVDKLCRFLKLFQDVN
jgi:hypothetical protein